MQVNLAKFRCLGNAFSRSQPRQMLHSAKYVSFSALISAHANSAKLPVERIALELLRVQNVEWKDRRSNGINDKIPAS